MKVSWLILTYNRAEKVQKAVSHNIENCGEQWDELVWVDNGSSDDVRDVMAGFKPDTSVLHKTNLGVGPGYNRAMLLATGEYMVITGCDMLMPKDWLKTFKTYMKAIPQTGIACMYHAQLSWVPERKRKMKAGGDWNRETINGLEIVHAMPIERRMFSRKLLGKIGYLREDFGLYGWEDCEWGHRAERVCDELGLLYYMIPGNHPEHLGTEAIKSYDGKDESEYHAFKQRESADPRKQDVMRQCREKNWPYYTPYV